MENLVAEEHSSSDNRKKEAGWSWNADDFVVAAAKCESVAAVMNNLYLL